MKPIDNNLYMSSPDKKEKESDVEKLSIIGSTLQNLYYKKKEQLEALQQEISELRTIMNSISSIVAVKSFCSADELYSKLLEKPSSSEQSSVSPSKLDNLITQNDLNNISPEDYFKENISKDKVKGTKIKRKVFSKENDEGELLCILNFIDLNEVEIKFIDPEKQLIKETNEDFINIFLMGALVHIKEKKPTLYLKYDYQNKTDIIECIHISNLDSINDFDLVTTKIKEFLTINRVKNVNDI